MRVRIRSLLLVSSFLSLAACGDADPARVAAPDALLARAAAPAAPAPSLVDVALAQNAANGEFSILIAALLRADRAILAELSARGQRTVFAPTDAAFTAAGITLATLPAVPLATLNDVLRYHVANGRRDAADVVSSDRIRMLNGGFTRIRTAGQDAFINDAPILVTDVAASNGIIHVIGGVLFP